MSSRRPNWRSHGPIGYHAYNMSIPRALRIPFANNSNSRGGHIYKIYLYSNKSTKTPFFPVIIKTQFSDDEKKQTTIQTTNTYVQCGYLFWVSHFSLPLYHLCASTADPQACVKGSTQITPSRSLQGYPQRCNHSLTPVARRARDAPRAGS